MGTANLSSDSATQLTFTPFLATSTDLDGSSTYNYQPSILHLNSLQNVTELQNLYKEYYPRNAKERPFIIKRMMTITWELTAGNEVSAVHVLGP